VADPNKLKLQPAIYIFCKKFRSKTHADVYSALPLEYNFKILLILKRNRILRILAIGSLPR